MFTNTEGAPGFTEVQHITYTEAWLRATNESDFQMMCSALDEIRIVKTSH